VRIVVKGGEADGRERKDGRFGGEGTQQRSMTAPREGKVGAVASYVDCPTLEIWPGRGSQISRQSAHEGGKVVSTGHPVF
jgi:hypothetical protein